MRFAVCLCWDMCTLAFFPVNLLGLPSVSCLSLSLLPLLYPSLFLLIHCDAKTALAVCRFLYHGSKLACSNSNVLERRIYLFSSKSRFKGRWLLSGSGFKLLLRHVKGQILTDPVLWPHLLYQDLERKAYAADGYWYNANKDCICCILLTPCSSSTALPLMTSGMRQESMSELISHNPLLRFCLISSGSPWSQCSDLYESNGLWKGASWMEQSRMSVQEDHPEKRETDFQPHDQDRDRRCSAFRWQPYERLLEVSLIVLFLTSQEWNQQINFAHYEYKLVETALC